MHEVSEPAHLPSGVRFVHKLLAPLAGGATGVGTIYGGLPPDLAPILAANVGQLVEGATP